MANQALAKRNDYDYSENFNYSRWGENTQVTLVNVPWNSDYRDVVKFSSQSAFDAWINAQNRRTIDKMSQLRWGQNVRINVPLNTAMRFNYLRAENPVQPVPGGDIKRNYYYFILEYRQIAPNTTELILQIDAFQSFIYDVTFGNCFVERGHIGIANNRQMEGYGRDYLTNPEGLDLGGEYRTVRVDSTPLIGQSSSGDYSVLVISTTELRGPYGDFNSPALYTAIGSTFEGMPSGASIYVFKDGSMFQRFMQAISAKPWVSQGILSVTIIPHLDRYHNWNPSYISDNLAPAEIKTALHGEGVPPDPEGTGIEFYAPPSTPPNAKITPQLNNWRSAGFIARVLGPYSGLKKFLTYPYMVIELTTFTGSPVVLKPEAWQDDDATLREMAALVPPGQRIVISPVHYNSDGETATHDQDGMAGDDFGDWINTAVVLDNFPTLPVVNNMAINYLASNKNGIAFQYTAADWAQQKALRGAQAVSDVAGANIRNLSRQSSIGNTQATTLAELQSTTQMNNMLLNTLLGGGLGAAGLAAGGAGAIGAGQAASGVAGEFTSANQALLTQNAAQVGNTGRSESAISSGRATGEIRDTNVALAQFAAKGDYETEIAGIKAKVQDARMIQPSTSGQFGGDAFNIINGLFGYSLRFKMLNYAAVKSIGNYWLRYGYAVEQFINVPESLKVMSKFTYWKLTETYITQAPIPEYFKQVIRGIFEKGVTVWTKPEYIGTTSLFDNAPIDGISY